LNSVVFYDTIYIYIMYQVDKTKIL